MNQSPLITFLYSQPLELVLIYLLTLRIECHNYYITSIYIK